MKTKPKPEALVYSVDDLPTVMGIGATTIRALLASGVLPSRKAGRRTLILKSDVETYLRALPVKVPLPQVDATLPTVADDPANPSPLDRIIDRALHAELVQIRKPSLLGPDQGEVAALAIGFLGSGNAANSNIPEPGEDI